MKTRMTKVTSLLLSAVMSFSVFALSGTVQASANDDLPEKYDSRDYGYLSPVRNQKSYGTCWAHGATAACEASLIKNNGFSNDLDLSEYHLAYSAMHKMYDRLGLFDSTYDVDYSQQYMTEGASIDFASITLAGWNGAVLDSSHREQFSSKKFDCDGLDQLDFASKELQYCMNAVKLTDYYIVKSKKTDEVKKYIMEYGAGAVSFFVCDEGLDNEKGIWYISDEMTSTGGHAVSVVGWDDTIPADDLEVNGFKPNGDGAFILKNSWGEGSGMDGYYYMPYESFIDNGYNVTFYSFDSSDEYTYNYGYDDLRRLEWHSDKSSPNEISAANVYTAADDGEVLKAVSFFPRGNETGYEIRVYTDIPENADSPESGTLRTVKSGGALRQGFRSIKLDEPVRLSSGERFAVVVSVTAGDDEAVFALNSPFGKEKTNLNADPKRGESYMSAGEGWQDVCDLGLLNPRIKALTYSDSASELTEPDDYDSYNGVTKAELVKKFGDLFERSDEIQKNSLNYDDDYLTSLNNYYFIYDSIVKYPEMFNASEVYATSSNYESLLDNAVYLNPCSMLGDFEHIAKSIIGGNTLEYPLDHPLCTAFSEEYDKIAQMAKKLELNYTNDYTLAEGLLDKLFALMKYSYEYGASGEHFGDVNNDGKVNINDATDLQRILAKLTKEDFYSIVNSDVNNDGRYDIQDVTDIQRMLAGLIDHFPALDSDFEVDDGYTVNTDRKTLKEYLGNTLAARSDWDDYTPNLWSSPQSFNEGMCYTVAKKGYEKADELSSAMLLYYARRLIAFVDEN